MKIIIDTETTGLDPMYDEIIELSIIDADTGSVIHSQRYDTALRCEWPAATAINGIKPSDVHGLTEIGSDQKIQPLIDQADWIGGWNVDFDLKMLSAVGIIPRGDAEIVDVMQLDAELCGMITPERNSPKWRKLAVAAEWWGYQPPDGQMYHSSMIDCLATRHVWQSIMEYRKRPAYDRDPYLLLRSEIVGIMDDLRNIQETAALSVRRSDLSAALSESRVALSAVSAMTSAISSSIDVPGCTSRDIETAILRSMYLRM